MTDEIARKYGFHDAAQFHRMVGAVDVSTPGRLSAFKDWQHNDGTREGLEKLPVLGAPSTDPQEVLSWLLTRIGSWTPARFDQHARSKFGDEATNALMVWLRDRGVKL